MKQTYESLAKIAIAALDEKEDGQPLWISVSGGPGAGKSTTAGAVASLVSDMGVPAVCVPMDGYHYPKSKLAEMDTSSSSSGDDAGREVSDPSCPREAATTRRGAPWTFDAESLHRDLTALKQAGEGILPGYSRAISDPVPDAIAIDKRNKIVLVEGNYLLLGALQPEIGVEDSPLNTVVESMGCPHPIEQEVARWSSLLSLWDKTWFVVPPGGLEEQRRRLIGRSLSTWTDEKTQTWGGGTRLEAATRRADFNDMRNAELVHCCLRYADVVIEN